MKVLGSASFEGGLKWEWGCVSLSCIRAVSEANATYVQMLGQQNRNRNQFQCTGPDSASELCHAYMSMHTQAAYPPDLHGSAPDALEQVYVALGAASSGSGGGGDAGRAVVRRPDHLLHAAARGGGAPVVLHFAVLAGSAL